MVIGYTRVSTDQQDLQKQKHLLLEYANANKLIIDEFIEVEISSRKDKSKRKIDLLLSKLQKNDILIVAELSRLGRNMFETLNLINTLSEKGVTVRFVRQPELSTDAKHTKLLLAIYGYFAESERDFISLRTKQGLAAAKASGKKLGRPKGSKNRERLLDKYKEEILELVNINVSNAAIHKIVNDKNKIDVSYNTYCNFINSLKK